LSTKRAQRYEKVFNKQKLSTIFQQFRWPAEKNFAGNKGCISNCRAVALRRRWRKVNNEFMLHIPAKSITILQVEKEALEPVYDFLKEEKHKDVFIQPQEKEIERYIYESKKPVVLLPLVSKSPLQKVNKVTTTTLEKLIVDLYSDQKLFAAFQGSELAHIVNNAYNRYAIDFTKLLHYAKRRKKDLELIRLFKDNTDIPQNIFR
jgi:hypothetical protein